MCLQGDGCDFPLSFHLIDDKGDDCKVKHPRGRIEMEGQFGFMFEMDVEFELIEVDFDGPLGFFFHFVTHDRLLK